MPSSNRLPRLPTTHCSRGRVSDALTAASSAPIVIVRGPGGSGKTTAVVDWLRHRPKASGALLWLNVDESMGYRSRFWNRLVRALVTDGLVAHDAQLEAFLADRDDDKIAPALVLERLERRTADLLLVLDDAHVLSDDTLVELGWLLERLPRVRVIATSRRRLTFESGNAHARLSPAVVSASDLAFTLRETEGLLQLASATLGRDAAMPLGTGTHGHALTLRLAVSALDANPHLAAQTEGARARVISDVTTAATQESLPAFADPADREIALRLALSPVLTPALARALCPQRFLDASLHRFAEAGLGEAQPGGDTAAFSFHAVVRQALLTEAERTLDPAERDDLLATIARHLDVEGYPIPAIRVLQQLGRYDQVWPVIARHFSALITHFPDELESVLAENSPAILEAEPTLAIALAVVRSEREPLPSNYLLQLVDGAVPQLEARRDAFGTPGTGVAALWNELSIFAGLRASRRYEAAAHAGDRVLAAVGMLAAAERTSLGVDAGPGLTQVMITYILVGRWSDAVTLGRQLSSDPHPGRSQHRSCLLAFAEAVRGEMHDAERHAASVTQAVLPLWKRSAGGTGWYVARALLLLERGDPRAALDAIAELDHRLDLIEHWPTVLWVRATARLLADEHEIALDELHGALARFRGRIASTDGVSQLTAVRMDLLIATGQLHRAEQLVRAGRTDSPAIRIARGRIALARQEPAAARAEMSALLAGDVETSRHLADALLVIAVAEHQLGLTDSAAVSLRRAFAILDRTGMRIPLSLLPRADLQTLVASGLPERAADLAGLPDPFHRVAYTQQLTTRERAVLELAAGGPTVEAIASALYVSPNTVKTQLRNVYRKLGASSRSEAILKARQRGIIDAGNGSTVT